MLSIFYYQDANGHKLAEEFIDSLDDKMQAKAFGTIEYLKVHGYQIGMPYSKHLEDGIFELRILQGGNAARVLYFFLEGNKAVLTHGFIKKTRKTPRREIKKAKKIRADWKRRHG